MIVALEALASCTSFSVMPPTPRCTMTSFTSSRSSLRSDSVHGLERALHVGLQHDVERGGLAALDLLEEVLEARTARGRDGLVANEPRALGAGLGERPGVREVVRDAHLVARERWFAEAEDLHGRRGYRRLDLLALVVDQGLDLAVGGAGDDGVADLEQALLDHDGRDGSATDFEVRFEHRATARPVGRRVSSAISATQQDLLEEFVDARALQRGDLDEDRVAAPLLGDESVLADLLEHAVGVGVGLVHLVDRDDEGDARRPWRG